MDKASLILILCERVLALVSPLLLKCYTIIVDDMFKAHSGNSILMQDQSDIFVVRIYNGKLGLEANKGDAKILRLVTNTRCQMLGLLRK